MCRRAETRIPRPERENMKIRTLSLPPVGGDALGSGAVVQQEIGAGYGTRRLRMIAKTVGDNERRGTGRSVRVEDRPPENEGQDHDKFLPE